jgi:hypothetical protein
VGKWANPELNEVKNKTVLVVNHKKFTNGLLSSVHREWFKIKQPGFQV